MKASYPKANFGVIKEPLKNKLSEKGLDYNWRAMMFQAAKETINEKGRLDVDDRIVDWHFLVPNKSTFNILVINSKGSIEPILLSTIYKMVYVVELDFENHIFLKKIIDQEKIKNISVIHLGNSKYLNFQNGYFDLVALNDISYKGLAIEMQEVSRVLKDQGYLKVTSANKLSAFTLIKRDDSLNPKNIHTYWGFNKIFKEMGYSDISIYSPLPKYNDIPMFYLPLFNSTAISFFVKKIFPLFDMVSTEVKKNYRFEFFIAKVGIIFLNFFKAYFLFKLFVPGFCIIARKNSA